MGLISFCSRKLIPILWLVLCTSASVNAQQVDAYCVNSLWTGDSTTIADGILVVQDGKVIAAGACADVDVPQGAKRHELGEVLLIPGLVIAQTSLVESTRTDELAVTPEVLAADGFDPFGEFDRYLAAGITTVQISTGGNRLMPGQSAVVKLSGEDGHARVLKSVQSLRVMLTAEGLRPPTVYKPPVGAVSVDRPLEPTQPQLATSLSQAIVGIDALLTSASNPGEDESLRALASVLASKQTVSWSANTSPEIQAALRLSSSFQLPWVISGVEETKLLQSEDLWESELAKGVILDCGFRPGRITNPNTPRRGVKEVAPVWLRAKQLIAFGAEGRIALRPSTDADLTKILYLAGIMQRGGLTQSSVMRMLTANPAQMLGVSEQVGILKPGADADFVLLSGRPLSAGSKVVATYCDGVKVYDSEDSSGTSADENAVPPAVVSAGNIVTAGGQKPGSISLANGKIVGLGDGITRPAGASVFDFGDEAYIVPGLVDCSTLLGLGGSLGDQVSLGTKLGGDLARDDEQIALGRKGGVTTAFLSSSRLPSPVLAFKLADSPRPLKDPVALRYQVRGNLTAAKESISKTLKSGKTYADAWDKYDAELAEYKEKMKQYEADLKKYEAAKKAEEAKKAAEAKKAEEKKSEADAKDKDKKDSAEKESSSEESGEEKEDKADPSDEKRGSGKDTAKEGDKSETKQDVKTGEKSSPDKKSDEKKSEDPNAPKKPTEPKKPRSSSSLEPYRKLFKKELVAMVNVSDTKAVPLVVEVFRKEFDVKTAVVGGAVAADHAMLLADHGVFVVIGPNLVAESDDGVENYAAELAVAGVAFGFQSQASTGVSELPLAVSYSVYEGLGRQDALKGLTTSVADFFGLEGVGAIEVGNDADLVVMSGPPLDAGSDVLAVMIDGRWVYEKEEE